MFQIKAKKYQCELIHAQPYKTKQPNIQLKLKHKNKNYFKQDIINLDHLFF
jgi:hypothetical protein